VMMLEAGECNAVERAKVCIWPGDAPQTHAAEEQWTVSAPGLECLTCPVYIALFTPQTNLHLIDAAQLVQPPF
jgi:hypothetical protein